MHEYGLDMLAAEPAPGCYDAIIAAVGHREFRNWGAQRIRGFGKPNAVLYDVKGMFARADVDARL